MWSWTGFITAETASLWGVRGHGYIASTQRRFPFSRAFTLFKPSVACLSFVGRPVFEKHLSQLFYNIPKNELLSLWRNRIDSLKSNHLSRLLRHACYVVIPCFRSIYHTKSAAGFFGANIFSWKSVILWEHRCSERKCKLLTVLHLILKNKTICKKWNPFLLWWTQVIDDLVDYLLVIFQLLSLAIDTDDTMWNPCFSSPPPIPHFI